MHPYHRLTRGLAAGLVLLAACQGSASNATPSAKDPNAPAEKPVLIDTHVIDTLIRKDSLKLAKPPAVAIDPATRNTAMMQGYALVAAMMINQDLRSLNGMLLPTASLILPDSTVKGGVEVAKLWMTRAKGRSLKDFQRQSLATRVIDDSTVADSGRYTMWMSRTPKDTTTETGNYTATWRARPNAGDWKLIEDHLFAGKPGKPGKATKRK